MSLQYWTDQTGNVQVPPHTPFGTPGSVVQFNRVATGLKQIAAHILGLPAVNHFVDWSMILRGLTVTCFHLEVCLCFQTSPTRKKREEPTSCPDLVERMSFPPTPAGTVDADIEDGLQPSEGPPAGSDEASTSSSSEDSRCRTDQPCRAVHALRQL